MRQVARINALVTVDGTDAIVPAENSTDIMKKKLKMFIVRKYIKAESVADALRKERRTPPDDVFIDDDWRKAQKDNLAESIGFKSKT